MFNFLGSQMLPSTDIYKYYNTQLKYSCYSQSEPLSQQLTLILNRLVISPHNTVIIICKKHKQKATLANSTGTDTTLLSAITSIKSKSKLILVRLVSQDGTGFSFSHKRSWLFGITIYCELKSSLCGAERSICPLSSGLKMNLTFKREDKGWGTGWVYWGNISMASGEVKAIVKKQWEEESSWQKPDIYLDFYRP